MNAVHVGHHIRAADTRNGRFDIAFFAMAICGNIEELELEIGDMLAGLQYLASMILPVWMFT